MIVASATVRSNFCGLSTKPGATMVATSSGIASSIRMVMAVSTVKRTPNTSSEKRLAPSMPLASISLANSGTKAALKAPSANSRRNVLGNWKAALNASAIGPVPSAAAISISRVKPSTRLISVPDATVANFRTRLIGGPWRIERAWQARAAPRERASGQILFGGGRAGAARAEDWRTLERGDQA